MKANLPKNASTDKESLAKNAQDESKQVIHSTNHFQRTGKLQRNIKKQQNLEMSTQSNSEITQTQESKIQNKPYVYTPLSRTIKTNSSNKNLHTVQKKQQQKQSQQIKPAISSFIKTSQIPIKIAQQSILNSPMKVNSFQKNGQISLNKQKNTQKVNIASQITKKEIKQISSPKINQHINNQQNSQIKTVKSAILPVVNSENQKKVLKTIIKQKQTQVQKKQENKQVSKILINRSKIIIFSLTKILSNKLQSHWRVLSQINEKKKKITNFLNIFQIQTQKTVQKINFYFKSLIFEKLRKNFQSKVKQECKNQITIQERLNLNRNTFISNLIQRIYKLITKSCFQKIKITTQIKKQANNTSLICLKNIEKNKLKEFFDVFVKKTQIQKNKKTFLIQRISQISKKTMQNCVNDGFKGILNVKLNIKIQNTDHKKLNSQPNNDSGKTVGPLKITKDVKQQIINNDQMKAKKSQLQNQIKTLRTKKIQQQKNLRDTIKIMKEQNQQKLKASIKSKQTNQGLKKKAQNKLRCSQQLSDFLAQSDQQSQPTLKRMHQIYMQIYKMTQQQFQSNVQSIYDLYKINDSNFQKIVNQWLESNKNLKLKKQIDEFQNNQNLMSQTSKNIIQQNQILNKFIRSYIKQRYMWEEVKQYITEALQ